MNTDTIALLDKHFDLAINAPDGIKRLREMILTLAMQGKLVPQDPKDQPASELLKEIEAEKKRLVKEKKTKEPKPLPPIKPEEVPYEVPEGWKTVHLGDVCQIIRGITFPSSEKTKVEHTSRIACLRTANVQNEIEWDDLLFIDRKFMTTEDKILQNDDIVISMANSRELVGKVALIKDLPYSEATFGGFLSIIRVYKIDARYVLTIFRSSSVRNKLIDSASQTTNIANISLAKLNPLIIPLPPLAEQRRIVAKIDELMARVDELERKRDARNEKRLAMHQAAIARLLDAGDANASRAGRDFIFAHFGELYGTKENVAELRKAILQLAVMGRLVPQDPKDQPASELLKEIEAEKKRLVQEGKIKEPKPLPPIKPEEIPYQMPKGWAWVRLGEMCKYEQGVQISLPEQKTKYHNGLSRFLRIIDYTQNTQDYRYVPDMEEKYYVKENDLVMVRYGASAGFIGTGKAGILANNLFKIIPWSIDKDFLLLFFTTPFFFFYLNQNVKGAAMPAISFEFLNKLFFPLPPLAEQRRIVAKVDELMALCDKLDKQIDQRTMKESALLEAVAARV